MRTVTFSLLAAAPLAMASDVVTVGMTGGWHAANVTDDNTQLLSDALSGSNFSKAVNDTRVCYSEVETVETQVVAGTNYRFTISGCDVEDSDGSCAESTLTACEPTEFVVQIFQQTWTDTLKVTSIKPVEVESSSASVEAGSASASDSESGSEETVLQGTVQIPELVTELKAADTEEEKLVDAWIESHGLNQYGDEATRMYVGGTPLFDETTGATMDRYDYIVRRHPDRPWQKEAETATLLAAEKEEAQGGGSVAGVLAMLGVFTVALAGVAILKMHQGRRDRLRYSPIRSRDL